MWLRDFVLICMAMIKQRSFNFTFGSSNIWILPHKLKITGWQSQELGFHAMKKCLLAHTRPWGSKPSVSKQPTISLKQTLPHLIDLLQISKITMSYPHSTLHSYRRFKIWLCFPSVLTVYLLQHSKNTCCYTEAYTTQINPSVAHQTPERKTKIIF